MARTAPKSLFTWLGLIIWGDVGDLTAYRRPDGAMILFSKTWPDKPPSDLQIQARARLADAAATWQSLSGDQRSQWHLAAGRASLCMHGYNLFMALTLIPDPPAKATLERQTHTTLDLQP